MTDKYKKLLTLFEIRLIMKTGNCILFCLFSLIVNCSYSQLIAPTQEEIMRPFSAQDQKNFSNPAKLYYPETWFHFVDGNVEKGGITKDLEAISKAGISGVQFFHGGNFGGSWPGVTEHVYCLSENWEDILSYTAKEAKRLGLRFTMQNCPGWSMAGGPWITKENAMRILTWTRTDVEGGTSVDVFLPVQQSKSDDDSDYRDIAVLAFPRPDHDIETPIVPSSVVSDTSSEQLMRLISGDNVVINYPASHQVTFEVFFPTDTIIRTVVLNKANDINYNFCYEPQASIKIDAELEDGTFATILESEIPAGAWQDPSSTLTMALDETVTSKLIVSFSHKHDFNLSKLQFLSAARKNSWESEAGWGLRKIPYASEYPIQDSSAFISFDSIQDISSSMDSTGHLVWEAPQGSDWIVLRIGNVNSKAKNGPAPKEAVGWECNKLSPEGASAQFDGYIGKYADGAVNGLLNGMLLDSWECNTQTWTNEMEEDFHDCTGYHLRLWLPALFGYVIGDQQTTHRFLRDWRYTINELIVENFYGEISRKAKEKGLHVQYETSGGDVYPMDIMEYYKYADVPMAEFWNHSTSENFVGSINFKPIRPTASAAHIYGKTRVSAEAFTSFWLTWNEHLNNLKENANRHMAQGVTHLVFHTYTHNPKADNLFPGTSFGSNIGSPMLRGQTWWKYMPSFTKYLARCTYMLERGLPSNDVLWFIGDDIDHKPDQRTDFMKGYNYDYCNRDVLLNRIQVKNGKLITPEGISYNILWYPEVEFITPETLFRIKELLDGGAIIVTSKPSGVATLMDYDKERFQTVWDELYSSGKVKHIGTGKIYLDTDINDVLADEHLSKDLIADNIDWNHRKTSGADWYFIAPQEGKDFSGIVDFRQTGKVELWDPVSGQSSQVNSDQFAGRTKINIHLHRGECLFVVFDHMHTPQTVQKELVLASRPINDNWTVLFPSGWGMPSEIKLNKLLPWKDLPVSLEGKAFSGTAKYFNQINLMNYSYNKRYILSLGNVDMIASVKVNGKQFEPVWTEPYSVDITSALDNGNNVIEIEVTSTWYNRLVYDAGQDELQRKTWTISGPSKDSPYLQSGLMGPVILKEIRK